jgi:hypothetical protein
MRDWFEVLMGRLITLDIMLVFLMHTLKMGSVIESYICSKGDARCISLLFRLWRPLWKKLPTFWKVDYCSIMC